MLKNKTPKASEVVAIKLITGEEIIAKLIMDGDKEVRVGRPLAMVMADNPENPAQTRVMFTPWMIAGDDAPVGIRNANIVAIVPARPDAAAQYLEAVGEGQEDAESA